MKKRLIDLTYRRSSRSHEDERAEVSSALHGESTGRHDEGADAIRLHTRADERGAPCGGRGGGLLGLEELLLGAGGLGLPVRLAEQRLQHGERRDLVEDGAERDGRRLDGGGGLLCRGRGLVDDEDGEGGCCCCDCAWGQIEAFCFLGSPRE